MRHYTGNITPQDNVIFVFGSNPQGIHGAGAARTAHHLFGAVYGVGEGLQGRSYAIPTKDLRLPGTRTISRDTIREGIRRMYGCAREHPDLEFRIAYRNTYSKTLNGYTGIEMIRLFIDAGPIPENVCISEEWHRTGMFDNL